MRYIAVDCGAGSGRVIVGHLTDQKIELEELHRFSNRQVVLGEDLFWDFLYLFDEIKKGIAKAVKKYPDAQSIGVDTWGVDFGLLDEKGRLLGNPYCYRDNRTQGVPDSVYEIVGKEQIYEICGTQPMEINTIFQLMSMKIAADPQLMAARHLLFTPDLINYFLTAEMKNEYTIASTSSLLDAKRKTWPQKLLQRLEIDPRLMSPVVHPGTVVGKLRASLCKELGCETLNVVAVGSHDTASAAVVTYSEDAGKAFLSSGTWSLIGTRVPEPILTPAALEHEFTNEGGVDNDILLIKNCTGLWLLQRVVAEWEQTDGRPIDYTELMQEAAQATSLGKILDTDDPEFMNPPEMALAITESCMRQFQKAPQTRSELVRLVLESLAMKYKQSIDLLEKVSHKKITSLHIVGGGSQNLLLNQLTSDYTGLPVMAGPAEATAMGNIVMQAVAAKQIPNMEVAAQWVSNSIRVARYQPRARETGGSN